MNPRTPIEDLELAGSTNLRRAKLRQEEESNRPPLAPEVKNEIAQLDRLIQMAMAACKHGQTVKGRRNPAFANLECLIKMRKLLSETNAPDRKKSGEEILAEANKLMGVN